VNEPVLVVRARRLRAARSVVVARDVTLDAAPGDVVAVEGPNGSGKSTLLAAAAGLLPADNASVRPGSVGYSPERAGVLPRVPLQRWLLGLARTAGLGRDESARRAGDLLARLGLAHASAMSLHALSRGNAQRALVAQALRGRPGPACPVRGQGHADGAAAEAQHPSGHAADAGGRPGRLAPPARPGPDGGGRVRGYPGQRLTQV
jgi:ABC-type Mn2+/Zn2+ transport system ATPase subunit